MTFPLRFRVTTETRGLEQAQRILSASLRGGLQSLGGMIQASIRSRTRFNRGEERRSVKSEVRGRDLTLTLTVYSELVQAVVDELGLPPGTFAPFRQGSRLFRWVADKGLDKLNERRRQYRAHRPKRVRAASHLTRSPRRRQFRTQAGVRRAFAAKAKVRSARAKSRLGPKRVRAVESVGFLIARSVFEHGIRPTMPFSKGLAANQNRIMRVLQDSVRRAVARINRGG